MKRTSIVHHYARGMVAATLLLIIMGALVTSTGSGLAVPDWPLSFGTLFPSMSGGVFFEHGHRLLAGAVGLLTLGFAVLLWGREGSRRMRGLGLAAVALVLSQALLGGLTVLLKLPASVSVAHACLAQTFFCLIVALAALTGPEWKAGAFREAHDGRLTGLSWASAGAAYVQLFLGAVVRHTGRGLSWHIGMAGVVAALSIAVLARAEAGAGRPGPVAKALLALGLIVLQIGLGFAALAWGRPAWVTAAHVGVGALVLGATFLIALQSGPPSPRWRSYLELTKPRITAMVLMTAFAGYFLAGGIAHGGWTTLAGLTAGLALVVGGANGLNQYLEREADALMRRTQGRPLPQKRLGPREALFFCLGVSAAGLALVTFSSGWRSGFLAWGALVLYVWVYTPLKRKTVLSTLVGAVPGALPPVIGWAAGGGSRGLVAALLFGILFLWQLPHFLSIAWIHREDYGRAGFPMLPVLDPEGGRTARHIVGWSLALVPMSLIPAWSGAAGPLYAAGALALGLGLLAFGVHLAVSRSTACARRLFIASDIYLPALLTLLVFGGVFP